MKKIFLVFMIILSSCSKNENNIIKIMIDENSFKKSTKLIGETLKFDKISTPFRLHVLRDSIVLIENHKPNPFYFELFNMKSGKIIAKFCQRGKGPNEFLSGKFISNAYNYSNSDKISIYDLTKRTVYEYQIDSLIKNSQKCMPIRKFQFESYVEYLSKLNENDYLCLNPFYLDSEKFGNDNSQLFITNKHNNTSNEAGIKHFTPNVSAGVVLVSPYEDKIIIGDFYTDIIKIYNKKLELEKTIIGPNPISPEYRVEDNNTILFKKGYRKDSYIEGIYTEKSVYLIYGKSQDPDFDKPNSFRPVEIFKMDWKGKLKEKYILDSYIYTLSISKDEKKMYGTTINSNGEVVLKKYELKNYRK